MSALLREGPAEAGPYVGPAEAGPYVRPAEAGRYVGA